MSDTPRTDEEILSPEIVHQDSHSEGWVSIDFARQLERELAAMTAYAERLEKRGGQMAPDTTGDMKEAWELTKETKP